MSLMDVLLLIDGKRKLARNDPSDLIERIRHWLTVSAKQDVNHDQDDKEAKDDDDDDGTASFAGLVVVCDGSLRGFPCTSCSSYSSSTTTATTGRTTTTTS